MAFEKPILAGQARQIQHILHKKMPIKCFFQLQFIWAQTIPPTFMDQIIKIPGILNIALCSNY